MRWCSPGILLVSAISTLVLGTILPLTASADTLSASQQIKITATVAPTRYIVVNDHNQIQQVISNTTDATVIPSAYRDTVRLENQQPLTTELQMEEAALLKDKLIKPGVLYSRSPNPRTSNDRKILLLLAPSK